MKMTNFDISHVEELLLCNFEDNSDTSLEEKHIQQLWNGEWEQLITTTLVKDILQNINNEDYIKELFNNIQPEVQEKVFCIGIASLFCFIQTNFTGPELSKTLTDYVTVTQNDNIRQYLSIDGEEIDVNVKYPEFLILTKHIFENCSLSKPNLTSWWYLRYVIIHQHLLDECSQSLYTKVEEKLIKLRDWNISNRLKSKLHLELTQLHLLYGQINECEKQLKNAEQLLQINFELSGEYGKRTKFQEKNVAQIILHVNLNPGIDRPQIFNTNIPEIIKLDDEIRLDQIQYQNNYKPPVLPITEQSLLLTNVQYLQKSRPKDNLLLEESEAYLNTILQQHNNWSLRYNTLLLRCVLESKHKRTIERCLSQCELLVNHLSDEIPGVCERMDCVWSCGMKPRWKIEAHLAELTLNLGLVKAALELYLRLKMWEEVIVCYTIMELRHKSAEIIKSQLDLNPSVKLWCLLGDATDDISCFEKAWELSQHKSARAQRHWGQFLFAQKKYSECIPHLQQSLNINSLQNMVWLRLGYAALETENWKLAASAYLWYTNLEPGGFEAWNNLAKAYIKLGQKTRAHYALQEALKLSFDNWKIWDNFMVLSASIGNYSDVIRSYHQILDLKEKHLDTEVLFILTKNILTNERILPKARELFGRLTSLFAHEPQLWELYAELSPTSVLKAQRLSRAYRSLVQDDWAKSSDKCGHVLQICERIGEVSLESKDLGTISSARLTLRSAISAAKKYQWEQHEECLQNVEKVLEKILEFTQ